MNYFRLLGPGFWVVQTDRHDLRTGDEIEVQMKDGSTKKSVVRKVHADHEAGQMVRVCDAGTPPVRRPLEEAKK